MPRSFLLALGLTTLLSTACSQAQSDKTKDLDTATTEKQKGKKGKKNKGEKTVAGLEKIATLDGTIRESSGLAHGGRAGTYYTHSDAGNPPILYLFDEQGKLLGERELPVTNVDWESLAEDNKGNVYVVDAGNNNNTRRDLTVYRVKPQESDKVDKISFSYSDQKEFPPAKEERNFDCEASLWHAGKLYLFTKDRAQQNTSKVYTLPDQPGEQTAQLLTKLAVEGEVTGADLSPDGRHLALMGREMLYLYEGNDLAGALKATVKTVSLKGAGQTEGVLFLDNNTLLISTEQGSLYRYKL
jgi:hypothetical protein